MKKTFNFPIFFLFYDISSLIAPNFESRNSDLASFECFLVTNGIKNVTWFYGTAEKNICACVYCLKQPDIFVYLGEYTILPLLFF